MTRGPPRHRIRVIVFHTRDDAVAALTAAAQEDVAVTLRTAPGAAGYAGPAYLKRVVDQALHARPVADCRAVIDCGTDPVLVMAAFREGWVEALFSGHPEERAKLLDIAGRQGASVLRTLPAGLDLLDLPDPLKAARAHLAPAARP